MLQNLHVKNLALIDEAEVDFQNGLNILTGETGAGKSLILGSVNLALGGKYSADMLRKGSSYGLVELTFSVKNKNQIRELENRGISLEEGIIILSRKLMEGRSISRINGETVPTSKLREVSSILIDIHGQHEHQSLLYKKNHLTILDAFAKEKIEDVRKKVKEYYQEYKKYKEELKNAVTDEAERAKEIDFLEFETEQIRQAGLKKSEDEILEEQYRQMVKSKKAAENIAEVYNYTGDEAKISEMLGRGMRSLQEISDNDKTVSGLYEQLVEIDNLLNDFNHEICEYQRSIEFSEEDFYTVENRLNEINRLKSKYGNSIEDILQYCEEKEERLSQLQEYDVYIEELEKKYDVSRKKLEDVSQELTSLRKQQALALEKLIRQGLMDLNFLDVQFEISFEKTEDYTANGNDAIEFLISMNPGEPVKPLGEIASGGELSRIMLAIKAVLADKDEIDTLIFDEIDVGISGRTAQKVSEKMKLIGKKHQVICITHLAQIAAMADTHFMIEKSVTDGKTTTRIHELDETESVYELARILGGAKITDTVLKNASEMKQLARSVS